jgi:[acyl-carrier-protein] S-malonyltransferase
MTNLAFLFPGQGSQKIGMGIDIILNYDLAKKIIDKSNTILDFNLKQLIKLGPEEKLNNTRNTQPAIFTISYILNQILKDNNIEPEIVAGHSLGEYSALAVAGAIKFESGLRLVRQRGILMDEALPEGEGSMAAVIGLEQSQVENLCIQVDGLLEIANYNTPQQIVISGTKDAINQAIKKAKTMGAKKVVELNVSGAFHSSLMKSIQNQFEKIINEVNISNPEIPIIANVSAEPIKTKEEIHNELLNQLNSSVQWVNSIKNIKNRGIDTFIEVGPGRVLKGLLRRIDRSLTVYNVNNLKNLEKVLNKFGS